MKTAISIGAFATALALAGCGGGGGTATTSSNLVGTFIDSPVSGLEFESPSSSGITDANGNFIYAAGEHVTFHIGNLYLGSAVPNNHRVTPLSLVPDANNVSDPRVTRILRTLQSMDSDGNLENGIQIDNSLRETLATQQRIDLDAGTTDDAAVVALIGEYKVSEDEARQHFVAHQADPSNEALGYTPPAPEPTPTTGSYALIAWNDLGMHCVDGKDYSVFSILPPYNNLHAHLINRTATDNKQVTSGVTLTYEAVADTMGSINTSSVDKTNFWDWALALFGASPAPDHGLNLNPGGPSNPTPSLTPAAMTYNGTHGWWEAEGIPLTPYDDKGVKNYYPMVKVVAKQGSTVLASTKVVLPVSDEMSCKACHASISGNIAAKPSLGWVNDGDPEKDWKKNILRLHDEKIPDAIATAGMSSTYTHGTLLASAENGQPALCAGCHKSNALGTAAKAGIKPLTEALHAKHATVKDPTTDLPLDDISNRNACYLCHPGSTTKCLRGVMGNAKKLDGSNAIDCQGCHGNMSKVGKAGREGWLDEPGCQHCHDKDSSGKFVRYTSVFAGNGLLRTVLDNRFGTNPNTPASGVSLYRFSKGHGNLQCEACHGSTHAEYPSSHANDNVQSLALQGHTGTVAECSVCHSTVPLTTTGGPHGLHTVGQAWVSQHGNVAEKNAAACAVCHGSDFHGGVLSKTSMARSFKAEGKSKSYSAGQQVGCYDCHNGPNGGD
jgi:hypothetical protein